jgi:hypothetical protein
VGVVSIIPYCALSSSVKSRGRTEMVHSCMIIHTYLLFHACMRNFTFCLDLSPSLRSGMLAIGEIPTKSKRNYPQDCCACYEARLQDDYLTLLKEASNYYIARGKVFTTLQNLTRRLDEERIPYVPGMQKHFSLAPHGRASRALPRSTIPPATKSLFAKVNPIHALLL